MISMKLKEALQKARKRVENIKESKGNFSKVTGEAAQKLTENKISQNKKLHRSKRKRIRR